MILRSLEAVLKKDLKKRHSFFLFGPRQVGKTTLVNSLLAGRGAGVLTLRFQDPETRLLHERDPSTLIRTLGADPAKKTVFIDEVQKVPQVLDAVQLLADDRRASFILTGSSARKLRREGANLLPGRVLVHHLDPLTWPELGWVRENRISVLSPPAANAPGPWSFDHSLVFGSLPGIVSLTDDEDRAGFLNAYGRTYLEEEIRAEALVRKIGPFSRFLELAARESGTSPNFAALSMEAGVSAPTVKGFYDLLEETLVVERVEPYLKNARKRILASPRYYFFDLGVRNALARLPLEPSLVQAQKGTLFEHAVVLEIIRRLRAAGKRHRVCFWRTSGGAEVDCVVDMGPAGVIPIEIKSGSHVRLADLRGLVQFLEDYPSVAKAGYVVTAGDRPERLAGNILAVPWRDL